MAESGFVGRDLHGDREETVIVAVDVGLNEGLELAAAGHSGSWEAKLHPYPLLVEPVNGGTDPCCMNLPQVALG